MQAGSKLRKWLREHEKTQVWLAREIPCSQSMVSYYLNGGRPSYDRMRKIAVITDNVAARLGRVSVANVSSEGRAGASALLKLGLDALEQKWFAASSRGERYVRAADARG